ncbi:MAG: hypothetical protein ABJH63_01415 [Rhizobiaceae bacterium]
MSTENNVAAPINIRPLGQRRWFMENVLNCLNNDRLTFDIHDGFLSSARISAKVHSKNRFPTQSNDQRAASGERLHNVAWRHCHIPRKFEVI